MVKMVNAKVLSAKNTNLQCAGNTLMSGNLKATIDKIKSLEEEKKRLELELDSLKKLVDAKAAKLECEVGALRDEVKSLKVLVEPMESAPKASDPQKVI